MSARMLEPGAHHSGELWIPELNPYQNKDKRLEYFWVPPRLPLQSSRFTGKEDALKWIEDSLLGKCSPDRPNNCHTVNLHGPGGIGKTQIALTFAHRFRDRFSSVFWIPSQTRTAVEHEFLEVENLEIARTLRLPTFKAGDEGSAHGIAYSVLEWLESSRNIGWLLIFDDVDLSAAPDVIELIPSTTCVRGHVIITSRALLNRPFAKTYRVDPLQVEESRALLKTYLGLSPYEQ
ncbi:P-loop containing nucleoside triphosphate hydrolase protein [Elaphomyces granulatus]